VIDTGPPEPNEGAGILWAYDPHTDELTTSGSAPRDAQSFCFDSHGRMSWVANGQLESSTQPAGSVWCRDDGFDSYFTNPEAATIEARSAAEWISVTIAGKARAGFEAPLSITTDSNGGIVSFLSTADADGLQINPDITPCCARAKLLRFQGDLSSYLNLPALTLSRPRAVGGRNGTLFFVARNRESGPWDLWKLGLDNGALTSLGVPGLGSRYKIAHDGTARVIVYGGPYLGEHNIKVVDDSSGATASVPIEIQLDCGPIAANGDHVFLACKRTAEPLWRSMNSEFPNTKFPPSIWPDPPSTFFTDLVRIDLRTGASVSLPAPADGWRATALAHDRRGTLYVAEATRQRVRALVLETGEIFDVVGQPGSQGVQLGALPASVSYPMDIAVLPDGSLAIADFNENVILVAK
jgi:hypothetical protein